MIKTLILCVLVASTLAMKCKSNGKEYENGDTWITDNGDRFKMKCTTGSGSWDAWPIACVTPQGYEVWPGDLHVENNKLYACNVAGYGLLESTWRDL